MLEAIPAGSRRRLSARVLASLVRRPSAHEDYARLAHHAEVAGDRDAVLEYASAASRHAVALHAHRGAAAQYARVLAA